MGECYGCVHLIKFLSRCWFKGPLVAFHWQAMFHVGLVALFAQYDSGLPLNFDKGKRIRLS